MAAQMAAQVKTYEATVGLTEGMRYIQEAIAAAAALNAAEHLGVLTHLSLGPTTASQAARSCGISERGTRVLFSALAGLGLVEAGGDGLYRATRTDLNFLSTMLLAWAYLAEAIRDNHPTVAGDLVAGGEQVYPSVVPHLGALFE